MVGEEDFSVTLAAVDEVVLGQLVHAAISDAAADEVTPPLTAGKLGHRLGSPGCAASIVIAAPGWAARPGKPPGQL